MILGIYRTAIKPSEMPTKLKCHLRIEESLDNELNWDFPMGKQTKTGLCIPAIHVLYNFSFVCPGNTGASWSLLAHSLLSLLAIVSKYATHSNHWPLLSTVTWNSFLTSSNLFSVWWLYVAMNDSHSLTAAEQVKGHSTCEFKVKNHWLLDNLLI